MIETLRDRLRTPASPRPGAWFPGRWIGGGALVLAPAAWFAGLLLRYLSLHGGQFSDTQLDAFAAAPFAAPSQLIAYVRDPQLVLAGDALFLLGAILFASGFVTLGRLVAPKCPRLAGWGATLLVVGLFARAYFAGIDMTAFRLIAVHGLDPTIHDILDSYRDITYGAWRVPVWASVGQYAGGLLLGLGLWRSGTFGTGRTLVFLWSATMWMGVLKKATIPDLVSNGLLCVVLVPLGIALLRDRLPDTRPPRLLSW